MHRIASLGAITLTTPQTQNRGAENNDARCSRFQRGPVVLGARGTATDDRPAFAVTDRNYLSARWPGDAYLFGRRFCALLASAAQPGR